jgi:hypothetical protein
MVFVLLNDLNDLLGAAAASVVVVVAFAFAVSLAILGASKYVDFGTGGRATAAYGSLVVVLLGSLVAVVIVAVGLYVMITR